MDMFERLLKLFGRDYWRMDVKEHCNLVFRYRLEIPDYNIKDENKEAYTKDPSFWHTLSFERKYIIDQLVARDKFASSFVAVLISVIALAVSILVAILK